MSQPHQQLPAEDDLNASVVHHQPDHAVTGGSENIDLISSQEKTPSSTTSNLTINPVSTIQSVVPQQQAGVLSVPKFQNHIVEQSSLDIQYITVCAVCTRKCSVIEMTNFFGDKQICFD